MVCVSTVWFTITGLPLASITGFAVRIGLLDLEMVCGSMSVAVV